MTARAFFRVADHLDMELTFENATIVTRGVRPRVARFLTVANPWIPGTADQVIVNELRGLNAGRPLSRHFAPVIDDGISDHEAPSCRLTISS